MHYSALPADRNPVDSARMSVGHDPFDLDAQEAKRRAREDRGRVEAVLARTDLLTLMSKDEGRRFIRWLLRFAGVEDGQVRSSYHSNYGQMCYTEGLRAFGLLVYSQLVEALTDGGLPLDHWKAMLQE